MNQYRFIILFCFIFFLATDMSYAAGMIMRVQQMKAMKQQQAQEEYQHEYQQQQGQAQGQQATAAVQQTYQQVVDQRNQAIAQAILSAHNGAVSTVNQQAPGSVNSPAPGPAMPPPQSMPPVVAGSSTVQDVVDLSEVWKKLDKKSTVWALLIDDQAKLMTVSEYISRFQQQGVKINQAPLHYVQMIDQISASNPQMLQQPFGQLIQILAIVDYDFDNGMDKDELARKVLGEAGFEENKKRFTQQSAQQQQGGQGT